MSEQAQGDGWDGVSLDAELTRTRPQDEIKGALSDRLSRFFAPKSLAIVGASEDAYWSRNAYTNLPLIGFSGRVVPVNPKRQRVFGLDCIPTLRQLDTPVDLAYIAAPPTALPAILEDAGAAGVRQGL